MFLGFNGRGFQQPSIKELDVTQLDSVRATHRFIDVRDPDELPGPLGQIPGAENIPLDRLGRAAQDWDRS